jgi:hypothetical protein
VSGKDGLRFPYVSIISRVISAEGAGALPGWLQRVGHLPHTPCCRPLCVGLVWGGVETAT